MPLQVWETVEEVKDILPRVLVKHGGKNYTGQVTGRKNRFATVSWPARGYESQMPGMNTAHMGAVACEFSWNTVLHSLQTGRPLRAD